MKKYYYVKAKGIDFAIFISINEVSKKILKYYLEEEDAIRLIIKWYFNAELSYIAEKSNKRKEIEGISPIELKNFYIPKKAIIDYKQK